MDTAPKISAPDDQPLVGRSPGLEACCAHLLAAADGAAPSRNAVLGLRYLLTSLVDLQAVGLAKRNELADLFRLAAPSVAADTEGRYPAENVYLGLAAAAGFVGQVGLPASDREPPALSMTRLDHAALLADEIDALIRRRRIEASGDLLRRSLHIARAREATRGEFDAVN